jgi:hypothetical protein
MLLLLLLRATHASVQRREKGNRAPDFSNPQMQMQMQYNASKQNTPIRHHSACRQSTK